MMAILHNLSENEVVEYNVKTANSFGVETTSSGEVVLGIQVRHMKEILILRSIEFHPIKKNILISKKEIQVILRKYSKTY